MKQLSGGQKTLVALALIFAIQVRARVTSGSIAQGMVAGCDLPACRLAGRSSLPSKCGAPVAAGSRQDWDSRWL